MLGGVAAGLGGALPDTAEEGVAAILMLGVEEGEVGGEALAEPDVVPVLFGDRVAEPLMGHLVGDQLTTGARRRVAVEDVGGQLHAAADAVGLDLGQLFVGIGTDVIHVELEDGLGEAAEGGETGVALLGE